MVRLAAALVMGERYFRNRLLSQARISECDRILDIGCGTGTLAIMAKEIYPNAEVAGLDPDAKVLGIARAKGANTDTELILMRGMSCEIPSPNNSFDRVLSSLMLHHLSTANKGRTSTLTLCRLVTPCWGDRKKCQQTSRGYYLSC